MSRPRSSTRGSGANPTAGGRSAGRPAGRPGVYVATAKSDVYVAMLGISLGAMVVAILLLGLLFSNYDFVIKPA